MADTVATIYTGLHASNNTSSWTIGDRRGWMRDTASYERRRNEIVAATNSASSDLLVNLGDTIDADCDDAQRTVILQALYDYYDANLSCDVISAIGNHIYRYDGTGYSWDGLDGAPSMTDYFTILNNSTSEPEANKANFDGPDGDPYCYEYTDNNGMVWIHMCVPYNVDGEIYGPDPEDFVAWLTARLAAHAATDTPCCVFSHTQLWLNANANRPTTLAPSEGDWAILSTIFDAAPTLQCVFGGHYHEARRWMKRNGIWYIDVGCSVSMPATGTAVDNNYIVCTIKPQEIWTPYGRKAQIQIVPGGISVLEKSYDVFAAC